MAGTHAEARALLGHGHSREAHTDGGDLESLEEFLNEGANLGRHDEEHRDDRAVVVAVHDQPHLLEALAEVARVVGQSLDPRKTGALAIHNLTHGGNNLKEVNKELYDEDKNLPELM